MIAYAIRRILWAIPTLFGISLVVFFLTTLIEAPAAPDANADPSRVLAAEDLQRSRFVDLPRFINTHPTDVRARVEDALFHLVTGDEQADVAAARLVRTGGAALPYVMAEMDRMPPSAKSRVAVALAPLADRMGETDTTRLRDPAQAPLFWTHYWEEHSTDYTEPSVRRTVDRLLVRESPQREAELAKVDTYALELLIDSMHRQEDRAALHRLMRVAARASGRGIVPKEDAPLADYQSAREDWRSWWFIHRADYVTYDGTTKVAASVLDTRYGKWMLGAVTSQLGLSTRDGLPIGQKLWDRAPITFALTFLAMLMSYVVAIPIGVISAWRSGKAIDATLALALLFFYSLPIFVLAQALSHLFDRQSLLGLAVPVLTLTAGGAAALSRHQRASMAEVLTLDYVRTARAKGVSTFRVLVVHALRNAIVSTTTLAGLQFPLMLGGAFVVEEVFGIQGLGWETLRAIETHDAGWLVAVVLFSAVTTMLTLIASDVATSLLDPRTRGSALGEAHVTTSAPEEVLVSASPFGFRRALTRMRRRTLPRIGAVTVLVLAFVTVFADLLASQLPVLCTYHGTTFVLPNVSHPPALAGLDCEAIEKGGGHVYLSPLTCHGPLAEHPGAELLPPFSPNYLLGTDAFGRDVFARTVHGARTSLTFAMLSMLVFVGVGVAVGALSGFFGGAFDALVTRAVETMSAFPTLILAIGVQALVPRPTILTLFAAIVLSRWAEVTKLVRAETVVATASDYANAARALGASPLRVLRSHVLPNARAAAIVSATFGLGSVVLAEASLTFLRAGQAANVASWGEMLSEVRDHPAAWWMLFFPGLLLLFVVLSFNVLGEALRDALDPRTAEH